MHQHEITQFGPLLDGQGNLREPGYAKRMLLEYDRKEVRGHAMRIKEWDYYLVMNGQFALALTIADNSYMGLDSISLLDFWENTQVTKSPMRLLPMGGTGMPPRRWRGTVPLGDTATLSYSGRRRTGGYFTPTWNASTTGIHWTPTLSLPRSRKSPW